MGLVISSVPVDLSQHAEVVMEKCVPLLSSQDLATRLNAQALVSSLALQCSDASAVHPVLDQLAKALRGMNSKL